MSHERIKIKAGNDPVREMPDTEETMNYIIKLSWASSVRVWFDSGETWDVECGVRTVIAI